MLIELKLYDWHLDKMYGLCFIVKSCHVTFQCKHGIHLCTHLIQARVFIRFIITGKKSKNGLTNINSLELI